MATEEFDVHTYAHEYVMPALELLLETLDVHGVGVVYKPFVGATYADCLNRVIQVGGPCLASMLRGDLAPSTWKLFAERYHAYVVRDAHDMVAQLIIHEATHLRTHDLRLSPASHDRFFHIHNRVYSYRYGRVLGDILRGGSPTSPPFFMDPDPEILRYRQFRWENKRGDYATLKVGFPVTSGKGASVTGKGRIVRVTKYAYHVRFRSGRSMRFPRWHSGLRRPAPSGRDESENTNSRAECAASQ